MKIKMLNNETIEKIAAGEIIVRPASVVKELVENSLDAGSTRIDVTIEKAGKKRIRIVDDGTGIRYNEIPLAFTRHATSKITTIDDLNDIGTLGFRGEALASIAAVSKVQIRTISEDEEMGSETIIAGGNFLNQRVCPLDRGTDIDVTDLFYNVPARQKHMQKNKQEENEIFHLMERIALSHPEVSFSLYSGERRIFRTPGSGELKDVIECLFGRNFFSGLRPIDSVNEPMTLKGYIGDLTQTRSTRDRQIFFINGRYVRNRGLSQSFESAYEGYMMQHRHPVGIIFMTLPGRMIDVNMHPSKTVVGILNESLVDILFRQGIRSEIRKMNLSVNLSKQVLPQSEETFEEPGEQIDFTVSEAGKETKEEFHNNAHAGSVEDKIKKDSVTVSSAEDIGPEPVKPEKDRTAVQNENQHTDRIEDRKAASNSQSQNEDQKSVLVDGGSRPVRSVPKIRFDDCRIVGQLFKTYILLERPGEILMIDQHAAHERFYFETLSRHFENQEGFPSQKLLVAEAVDVSAEIIARFDEIEESLARYGFECDIFGENTLSVRSVPIILGEPQDASLVTAFAESLLNENPEVAENRYYRIATMACKKAIKGNQTLSMEEIRKLLDRMTTLENPYTCPHGRPIIMRLREYDLQKLFKRVVS